MIVIDRKLVEYDQNKW